MNPFEELQIIKNNISNVLDPTLLFHMNQKVRQLEEEIKKVKTITINYELIKN